MLVTKAFPHDVETASMFEHTYRKYTVFLHLLYIRDLLDSSIFHDLEDRVVVFDLKRTKNYVNLEDFSRFFHLVVNFACLVVKMGHLVVILNDLVVKITGLVVIVK